MAEPAVLYTAEDGVASLTLNRPQVLNAHSHEEHAEIVAALAARDEALAVQLMHQHLEHVEASLIFDREQPVNELSLALSPL